MTTDTQSQLFPIDQLTPYKKNSKKHTEKAIDKMVSYITEFGFTRPVLVWGEDNTIVAGHRATLAAKKLGMNEVPIRRVDHLSETQMRALVILDNKSPDDSPFDSEILLEELTGLADLEFKIELTGFDMDFLGTSLLETGGFDKNGQADDDEPEDDRDESERAAEIIDREIIGDDDRETSDQFNEESEGEESADSEDLPIPFKVPERVTAGSAWRLGKHLLVCGNSSDASTVHKFIPEESAHSIVSDPPYGISFMGKEWDHGVPSAELWKVWFSRVTPGAHILSFCATRMYHHMAINIENAGFEPRDMISWMYGSGMPKSMNISKAIDKAAGAEREVIGTKKGIVGSVGPNANQLARPNGNDSPTAKTSMAAPGVKTIIGDIPITAPSTASAKQWDGFGTGLKPANEPIMLARKPHTEPTIAKNVQRYGTGGLNIDGSRVKTNGESLKGGSSNGSQQASDGWDRPWKHDPIAVAAKSEARKIAEKHSETNGRWPSNVILSHADGCVEVGVKTVGVGDVKMNNEITRTAISTTSFGVLKPNGKNGPASYGTETVEDWHCVEDCPVRILDEQSGILKNGGSNKGSPDSEGIFGTRKAPQEGSRFSGDSGGASRFFMVIKKSITDERDSQCGLEKTGEDATFVGRKKENRKDNSNTDGFGNKQTVQFLMGAISIIETETHSITTFQILSASTRKSIGLCTVASEKITSLLTVSTIESVKLVSNTDALIYFTDESQEPIKGTASIVIEPDSQSGVQKTENTITPTIDNIAGSRFFYVPKPSRADKSEGNDHATVKPLRLMQYLIKLVTPPGGTVLEPFAGSGTTLLAAEKLHMKCIAFELDPHHCDIILARWEQMTNRKAEPYIATTTAI